MKAVIVCHPDNVALLPSHPGVTRGLHPLALLRGIPVRTNEHMPRYSTRWFPPDSGSRLWSYTASDEAWAAPLGIGRYADDTSAPVFLLIDFQSRRPRPGAAALSPLPPRESAHA